MNYGYSQRALVPNVTGSHYSDSGSPTGPYFSDVSSANAPTSGSSPRSGVSVPNGMGMTKTPDYGDMYGWPNHSKGPSMTASSLSEQTSSLSDRTSVVPAPTSAAPASTSVVLAPTSVVSYRDCFHRWCPPPRPCFPEKQCGSCHRCRPHSCRPCNPCKPCGNCTSCRPLYSHAQNVINATNWARLTVNNTHRSIIHLESIEVAVPTTQLLQRAKTVLPERDFPVTASQLFNAKFMEGLDVMKMTDAVAALGESLSKKLEMENIKGRITALLRPFFLTALGSGKDDGKNPAVAFSLNGDHVTVLNNADDDAKDAQREGRAVAQEDIDKSQNHLTSRTSPTFYQILITAAYSYRHKVFNFGYCYIQRKDSSVAKLLGDPYTKAKRVAAMEIECSAPLAQVLRAMSFSRCAVTLVRNDDNFKRQAALL